LKSVSLKDDVIVICTSEGRRETTHCPIVIHDQQLKQLEVVVHDGQIRARLPCKVLL
jgi:hypothetical protein